MSVKTTGDEFNRFYLDKKHWPHGWYHEEEEIYVDNVLCDENRDYDQITGSVKVKIKGGEVHDPTGNYVCSFESFFKKWQKKQNTVSLIVEVEKEEEPHVKAILREMGARIK